jgi:hypothetical protein
VPTGPLKQVTGKDRSMLGRDVRPSQAPAFFCEQMGQVGHTVVTVQGQQRVVAELGAGHTQ